MDASGEVSVIPHSWRICTSCLSSKVRISDSGTADPPHATRRSVHRWFLMVAEATRAAFAGRLEEADRMTEEALALNRRHGDDCWQEHTVQRLVLARLCLAEGDASGALQLSTPRKSLKRLH